MHTRKPRLAALALLLSGCLLGTAAAQNTRYPLTVTDDLGRQVTLTREPMRIVSMLPSHTETVIALGAANKLVGIDEFSNFPANVTAGIPKVGNGFQPNMEAIVALKPDLVLVDESASARLAERMEQAGLNVYAGTPQTFNEVFQKIAVTGQMLNRQSEATRLITRIRSDIRALEQAVRNRPVVSVYYEIDPTPYTVGPNSFVGSLIQKARGRNIVPAGIGDFPKISPELVVTSRPQVMIGLTPEAAKNRPGWGGLPAVQQGRVYTLSREERDALSRAGPRLAQALRALIRVMHPGVLRE